MQTTSTAKVSKDVIRKSYENLIEFREQHISNTREPYIQKAMQHKFWQKILGKPARTREEAIKYCDWMYDGSFSEYHWCSIRGWGDEYVLENLLALSKITEDEFIICSASDAEVIFRNLNRSKGN